MADVENKAWFARKRVGWGWEPRSWQGWLVLIAVILAALAVAFLLSSLRPS